MSEAEAPWPAIKEALGDEKPGYTYLETPSEAWFSVQGRGLRVWSQGELYLDATPEPAQLPKARRVFHHAEEEVFVELAEYADEARLICAVDNGALFQTQLAAAEIPARAEHYRALGFREINAWNLAPDTILWREYRRDRSNKDAVVVSVDGEESCRDTYASHAEAVAAAEARVLELLGQGYVLHLMEQYEADNENPETPDAPEVPELSELPPPSSAYEAVDQAVERLRELHRVLPKAHLVVELLDLPAEAERLEAMGHEHFTKWYPDRVGRWLEPQDADAAKSSFDYFLARYGSLTWVLRPGTPDDLGTFYCGNVSGGGLSPIEIHSHDYPCLKELSSSTGEPGYLELNVFHGGWHDGLSYALDTRFTSPEGEHPIVHFDECQPRLPAKAPETIKPFGYWLLERVNQKIALALPWLARFQD